MELRGQLATIGLGAVNTAQTWVEFSWVFPCNEQQAPISLHTFASPHLDTLTIPSALTNSRITAPAYADYSLRQLAKPQKSGPIRRSPERALIRA